MPEHTEYPRVRLKCICGNIFNVNVMRMKEQDPIVCQVCGDQFPEELGLDFAKAFEDLYKVKYKMEKDGIGFEYAFLYKSSFNQPPAPYPIDDDDKI